VTPPDSHPTSKQGTHISSKRIVNQMSTKLPFSNGGPQKTEVSSRVLAGLVPGENNKTKALSKNQEKLYSEVL